MIPDRYRIRLASPMGCLALACLILSGCSPARMASRSSRIEISAAVPIEPAASRPPVIQVSVKYTIQFGPPAPKTKD